MQPWRAERRPARSSCCPESHRDRAAAAGGQGGSAPGSDMPAPGLDGSDLDRIEVVAKGTLAPALTRAVAALGAAG